MKKYIKLLAIIISLLLTLFACVGCSLSTKKDFKSKDSIKYDGTDEVDPNNIKLKGNFVIGATAPLTGDGSVYGISIKNSAQMAVDEINAAGGLYGAKLTLLIEDDKQDISTINDCYNRLKNSGMCVSMGSATTKQCLEFTKFSNADNIFIMTPSASGDEITTNKNVYQMCYSDNNQGFVAADYLNKNYFGQTVGVLYESDSTYSTGIFEKFKNHLDKSINIIETPFKGEYVTSFNKYIPYLQNCDVIFMPIHYDLAEIFIYEANNILLNCDLFLGCANLKSIETTQLDINNFSQKIAYITEFDTTAAEGPASEFIAKYTKKYGANTLNTFGALAYDTIYAIYNAMKTALDKGYIFTHESSPQKISNILNKVFAKKFTFTGITGAYINGKQTTIRWSSKGQVQKEPIICFVSKKVDMQFSQ